MDYIIWSRHDSLAFLIGWLKEKDANVFECVCVSVLRVLSRRSVRDEWCGKQWKTDSIKEIRLAADHAGKALPQKPSTQIDNTQSYFLFMSLLLVILREILVGRVCVSV